MLRQHLKSVRSSTFHVLHSVTHSLTAILPFASIQHMQFWSSSDLLRACWEA
jgi:hypothetical protein